MVSTSCSTRSSWPSSAPWGPSTRPASSRPSASADGPRGEAADPGRRDPAGPRPPMDAFSPLAHRLIAIVGPTGAGKSELALRLAGAVASEIVSCDSLQVYRGLDVGSAKPS